MKDEFAGRFTEYLFKALYSRFLPRFEAYKSLTAKEKLIKREELLAPSANIFETPVNGGKICIIRCGDLVGVYLEQRPMACMTRSGDVLISHPYIEWIVNVLHSKKQFNPELEFHEFIVSQLFLSPVIHEMETTGVIAKTGAGVEKFGQITGVVVSLPGKVPGAVVGSVFETVGQGVTHVGGAKPEFSL